MGITDFFSDLVSSFGLAEAQAEAPPAEQNDESVAEQQEEKSEESTEPAEEASEGEAEAEPEAEEGEEEAGEEEEEQEEEEEEEVEDIKPKLEADCARSAQCAPYKHHFDECVERVTRQQEDPDSNGPKEDCVEEFFHLQHCATQCAAPKLWKSLR